MMMMMIIIILIIIIFIITASTALCEPPASIYGFLINFSPYGTTPWTSDWLTIKTSA
jgi:hypothetical protein